MPITLVVNGNAYQYPKQGEDPNWGDEAQLWAEEVTKVLNTVVGSGDILEDNFPINNNINVYTDISKLNFNPSIVRSATINYVIHRTHDLNVQTLDATGAAHSDFVNQVGSKATGTVTVVDYSVLAGATLTVYGSVLTEGVEWTASVDNDTTAASLAAAIDALVDIAATSVGNVIAVEAEANGVLGNTYTLATSDVVNLTISGATLLGGVDDVIGPAKYFTITSANDATSYYVWFSESPNDQDPLVVGKTAIPVIITPLLTVADILETAASAINATLDFNANENNTEVLTIECAVGGPVNIIQSTTIPNTTLDLVEQTFGLTEAGEIQLIQLVPINNVKQWQITQNATGNAGVAIDITPAGQIRYQSTNLTGLNYTGKITFTAQVLNV
jgi:hypothetical protein